MRRTYHIHSAGTCIDRGLRSMVGYYGPALITANQELGSVSQNAGMWDLGAGLEVNRPRTGWKMFAETGYFSGLTNQSHTS